MTLKLDETWCVIDISKLICEIERGFRLYSEGRVNVPPVGFLHFGEPPGDVHIKYGAISGDKYYVLKLTSTLYNNPGLILIISQKIGQLRLVLMD